MVGVVQLAKEQRKAERKALRDEKRRVQRELAARRAERVARAKIGGCVLCGLVTVLIAVLLILHFAAGCSGNPCGEHGSCSGLIATCTCEVGHAGEFCERSCGTRGASGGLSCDCVGNFIGQFCDVECGCSGVGNQTNIWAAREAGTCSAGSCACGGNRVGEFCERNCDCSGNGNQTAIDAARAAGTCASGNCTCFERYQGDFCELPTVELISQAGATCASLGMRPPVSQSECEAAAAVSGVEFSGGIRQSVWGGDMSESLGNWRDPRDMSESSGPADCWDQTYPRCSFYGRSEPTLLWAEGCGDNPHNVEWADAWEIQILCV